MKNLRKIIFWILFSFFIFVLIYLFSKWVIIAKQWYESINKVFYIILFIIFLYYIIFYVIKPTSFKRFKVVNTVIWLFIIYVSQKFIANSWVDWIYYWDILCLIWVLLTIIWPTNALISKKDQQEKDVEIIEA